MGQGPDTSSNMGRQKGSAPTSIQAFTTAGNQRTNRRRAAAEECIAAVSLATVDLQITVQWSVGAAKFLKKLRARSLYALPSVRLSSSTNHAFLRLPPRAFPPSRTSAVHLIYIGAFSPPLHSRPPLMKVGSIPTAILLALTASSTVNMSTLFAAAAAAEQGEGASDEYYQASSSEPDPNSLNENPEENWGYYYDPKNEFCGEYDCYKILGFDYESFGRSPPDTKMITQSYRLLSRKWHPDKNRGKEGAEERFVKINKAHKVLTSTRRRKEYDYLRDRPDEYIARYGTNVLFSYAPKSDVTLVALILLIVGNLFTWFVQKNKWQTVADHVAKLALEGVGLREGGTDESIAIREQALEILAQQKKEAEEKDGGTDASASAANSGSKAKVSPKKKGKATKKEQKEQEMEELRPIVIRLVKEEHKDFGGGFHQPTWKDLLITKLALWPIHFTKAMAWQVGYWLRRLRGLELSDDEREVLTRRAVGEVTWHALSDEDRVQATKEDLWISKNLEDWREMQEVKKWGPGYQKKYARWKKKQGSKIE